MKRLITFLCLLAIFPATGYAMEVVLTPNISVREEYTDNVDRVDEDREHDWITSVMPSLSLDLIGRTSGVTISYQPSWVHYERTQDYDYWRHRVSLRAHSQLGRRLNLNLGGAYLQSEDEADTEDPTDTIDTDYTRREGRYKFHTYSTDAGLNYQFGDRDTVDIGMSYGGTENDDPTLEDSNYYRPSLTLTYWFGERWGTSLSGAYERGVFDAPPGEEPSDDFDRYNGQVRLLRQFNRQLTGNVQYAYTLVTYDGDGDDERTHDFSTGFDYLIEQDMTLAVQVGYSIIETRGGDNESDVSGTLGLTKTFQRGSLGINASTGYDYSYYNAENLGLNYYVGAGLTGSYTLSRRLSANAYADYRYSEYRAQTPQRDDDRFTVGGGLSYQLLQWLFCGAGYTFSMMDSSEDGNDYTENRVYVSLTATPTQPLRW